MGAAVPMSGNLTLAFQRRLARLSGTAMTIPVA
jgi:hypothetical protein